MDDETLFLLKERTVLLRLVKYIERMSFDSVYETGLKDRLVRMYLMQWQEIEFLLEERIDVSDTYGIRNVLKTEPSIPDHDLPHIDAAVIDILTYLSDIDEAVATYYRAKLFHPEQSDIERLYDRMEDLKTELSAEIENLKNEDMDVSERESILIFLENELAREDIKTYFALREIGIRLSALMDGRLHKEGEC